jgi:hypothetical protein
MIAHGFWRTDRYTHTLSLGMESGTAGWTGRLGTTKNAAFGLFCCCNINISLSAFLVCVQQGTIGRACSAAQMRVWCGFWRSGLACIREGADF